MQTTARNVEINPATGKPFPPVHVNSEVARLRRVIIHSPDGGLGKIIPTKAQDWLFEDIVHLESMRRNEYDLYVKLLLFFLDPEKIKGRVAEVDDPLHSRNFYKPDHPDYFCSDKVVDPQYLLMELLGNEEMRLQIVASCCAHEGTSYANQRTLLNMQSSELAKTLISGILPNKRMIFSPIPNYIFTRDIGTVVNQHILVHSPAKKARSRESILTKYLLYNHPMFGMYRDNIIEISNGDDYFLLDKEERKLKKVTVEGGDVMTVAPNHLLIGVSERTSIHAANYVIRNLFQRDVVEKVTVIKIPKKRAFMHIDTTFTQVKRNMWVIFAPFSRAGQDHEKSDFIESLGEKKEPLHFKILQFTKGNLDNPKRFEYLEELLDDISRKDLKSTEKTEFIYSGDGEFPFEHREQWTDSCNVLAVKEGVVMGYDRNDKTGVAFGRKGFDVVHAADLIRDFEHGRKSPDTLENTLILLPSAELSRARGGSHCISMPILRESIF